MPLGTANFTDADIVYSFNVTATGSSDIALLTFATGVVTQTNGTPTISDGDGKDFEGITLPTTVTYYAIMVEVTASAGTPNISATHSDTLLDFGDMASVGDIALRTIVGGATDSSDTLAITLVSPGDACTVTVIGKSS